MKNSGRLLLIVAFGALAIIAAQAVRSRLDRAARLADARSAGATPAGDVADSAFADSVIRASEDLGAVVTLRTSGLPAPVRDSARIAALLAAESAGTYIGAILAARDSTIYRWYAPRADPVRVWVQEPVLTGFDPTFHAVLQDAFRAWTNSGIPLEFRFVIDSARADVHVTWVDRYESRTSGRTRWAHDQHGWIVGGGIELALHQPDGRALEQRAILAIARHEVGHLIGLDHSPDEGDVMSANVRVSDLSETDRRTIRLVYGLPAGPLRPR